MRRQLFYQITLILLILCSAAARGQGCSDAGFCTIGSLASATHPDSNASKQSLSFAFPIGIGDEGVLVLTPAIEYNRIISQRLSFQAKLTGNYATGSLGAAAGAGDVFLAGTYNLHSPSKWKTSLTLGAKLPLNNGNLRVDDQPLPMQYQSSLGTVDLIAGVSVSSERWQFAAGYQQPLTGTNGNNFLPAYWDDRDADKFPSSNDFNRKADLLVRVAYIIPKLTKWQISTGILGIYHVSRDTYIDGNASARPIPIEGSMGLTLNATIVANYQLSKKLSLGLTGGVPLVVRDVRPDGLTRSFVISPDIRLNF